MEISAKELSDMLNGTLEGDPEVLVSGPSKIEEGKAGTISFLANPKYESFAYTTNASVLLVDHRFQPQRPINPTLIRVDDVYASVAFLLDRFDQGIKREEGISSLAFVHTGAKIGKQVSISPFAVIEEGAIIGDGATISAQVFIGRNVAIGKNTVVFPGAKIYADCQVGDACTIHANAVIGSDGFGFAPQADGTYKKVAQLGNVILEDQVEIGANTVIDRATMGSTRIKKGTKLDNLVQIAHNVEIGENSVIAAQAGIAGSTRLGKACMVGGQAGFVGHIQVADGTKVQAQSGVASSIKKENTAVYGSPALSYNDYLRSYAVFKQLPNLQKQLNALQKEIDRLKSEKE